MPNTMTTLTNWPNPERPGWPPDPEKDGLYAMRIDEKFIVRYWSAARQHYSLVPGWKKGISPSDASVFTFCGEIFTPTQIAEMLAGERERCAQEAIQIGESWGGTELSPTNTARHIAHSIRSLGVAP